MIEQIEGYKEFNDDMTNRYKMKFEVGKLYIAKGIISFGNDGNGFHMCKRIEDTLRYYDAFNQKICLCKVIGSDDFASYYDDYYGYYDLYTFEKLYISKKLTYEDILDEVFKMDLKKSYKSEKLEAYIEYYQENNKDAFTKRRNLKWMKL